MIPRDTLLKMTTQAALWRLDQAREMREGADATLDYDGDDKEAVLVLCRSVAADMRRAADVIEHGDQREAKLSALGRIDALLATSLSSFDDEALRALRADIERL